MAVVDARIRVHHPCPYCGISDRYPRSVLLLWCDNRRDTFLVTAPEEAELLPLVRTLRTEFRAHELLRDGTSSLLELPDFEWKDPPSVTGLARRGRVWVLPPVVYADGTETYRMVAATRSRLNALIRRLRRLGTVEILSITDRSGLDSVREYPAATVHFFEGLSPPQIRALLAAQDGGLLDVPARASWEAVSRALGVSRSTFGEHLRKAQGRLLRNSYTLLKARAAATASPPRVLPRLGGAGGERPAPGISGGRGGRRRVPRGG